MASKKLGNVLGSTLKMIKADRKIYPKEKIPTITRESFCFFKTLRIIVIFLEWRMILKSRSIRVKRIIFNNLRLLFHSKTEGDKQSKSIIASGVKG